MQATDARVLYSTSHAFLLMWASKFVGFLMSFLSQSPLQAPPSTWPEYMAQIAHG